MQVACAQNEADRANGLGGVSIVHGFNTGCTLSFDKIRSEETIVMWPYMHSF